MKLGVPIVQKEIVGAFRFMRGYNPGLLNRGLSVAGVVAILAGMLWLWLRPVQVSTAEVRVRELNSIVQGVGTVEAKIGILLAAKIAGRITQLNVDQGDAVHSGQLLVQLESAELSAEVERAGAVFDRTKLSVPAQQAALARAQAGLAAARAAVAKAKANRSLAQANAERWSKLASTELVAQMELDERRTAAQSADEELRSAEALYQAALREVELQEITLTAVPKDVAAAAASLASVTARKAETQILSPIDGFVVSREVEAGTAVNPGTPILKLADPASIWVTVFVDEREAGALAAGDAADIALRSMAGRTYRGKIVRIRRESDRVTEQLTVDIRFEDRPVRLTLGEQAEATLRPAAKKALAIPLAALVQSPKGAGAWTVIGGRMRFKPARFGVADGAGWVEVIEGFAAGERVITAPGRLADAKNDGRRVTVAPEKSAALAAQGSRP